MSDNLRERVARAIFAANSGEHFTWDGVHEIVRTQCFAMADAALAEMGGVRESVDLSKDNDEAQNHLPRALMTDTDEEGCQLQWTLVEGGDSTLIGSEGVALEALRAIAEGKD